MIYRVSAYHLVLSTFLMLSLYIHTQYTLRTLALDLNLAACEMMGDNLTATARNNGKLRSRRDKLSRDLNSCGETVFLTFKEKNVIFTKALLDASFRRCSRLGVALTGGSSPTSWLLTRRRLHATLGHALCVLSPHNTWCV